MAVYPHEVLATLREKTGMAQMTVFAEALVTDTDNPPYRELPMVAAAYMLGRADALKQGATEVNGSGGPMAEAVLKARGMLHDGSVNNDDLPF